MNHLLISLGKELHQVMEQGLLVSAQFQYARYANQVIMWLLSIQELGT
jgi:hypothetical protein